MNTPILQVGYNKHGEIDFSVSGTIQELTPERMNEFREMIVVGIGIAEDMWRRHRESLPENQAAQEIITPTQKGEGI